MSTLIVNPSNFSFNYTANSILFECTSASNTVYDFVVPTDNPLTIVAVGAGGGGVAFTGTYSPPGSGGGYLRWTEDIVIPRGTLLRITVGANGVNYAGDYGGWTSNAAKAGGFSSVVNQTTGSVYLLAPGGHGWSTITSVASSTFQSTGNRGTQTRSAANGSFTTGSKTVDGISYTVSGGDGGNGGLGIITLYPGNINGSAGAGGGGGAGGYTGNGGAGASVAVTLQVTNYIGGPANGTGSTGGGGGGGRASFSGSNDGPNGGGGVKVYGSGNNGSGATTDANPYGGSGSSSSGAARSSFETGTYGGGAGGRENSSFGGNSSQDGAVWIRWKI